MSVMPVEQPQTMLFTLENILALTVYVTCEGLKVLDGDLTWISTLVDVVLPQD
jgi:hypothetical protein